MAVPLQVTFKGMESSPALEARIREKAARLGRFEGDILRCHVTIEAPHHHHRKGRLFRARVEVFVPRGDIVVTRESPQDHAHEDAYVAVRDAFDAAVRQLEDHVRKRDHRTTPNEPVLAHGRVARFVAGEEYGFIETGDGQEVYFHRNSVAGHAFDRLRVGDPVRLTVTEGEKGPQAGVVHPAGHD
ncbi:HPF/RaiA family ribosome-associated protein [Falsiroseomonas oryziterrae]|uniref:HPF/RaiA family ribosome-associated protein n=1 Tax=Falsiroseomonas oryziterrae TaxID=2911368 RepID=UPI001F016B4D|nr:HPF/RaiA family ribosome-associated protein [Roseomonas sp. NPKOSM-4]